MACEILSQKPRNKTRDASTPNPCCAGEPCEILNHDYR
nr:MAG TPA: hypothetical protein [Caudoviricetes sp.]